MINLGPEWGDVRPRPHSRIIGIGYHVGPSRTLAITPELNHLIESNHTVRDQHDKKLRKQELREDNELDESEFGLRYKNRHKDPF